VGILHFLISAHTAKFFNSLHLFLAPMEVEALAGEAITGTSFAKSAPSKQKSFGDYFPWRTLV